MASRICESHVEEVALARKENFTVVSLGPRILRVETAALALASVLLLTGR